MLKVHTKRLDSVEILGLEGQIINGQTDILRDAVQQLSAAGDIILDFSDVTLVDAHGLGVLLQLRERALTDETHFELINVNESLSRIFEITRLNTVFEIYPSGAFIPTQMYAPQLRVAA